MAIVNAVALCTILWSLHINYLQINNTSSSLAGDLIQLSHCAPLWTVNPTECGTRTYIGKVPPIGKQTVLLVGTVVRRKYLRFLEGVCYPTVHVWCWLMKDVHNISVKSIPPICDGLILAEHVEIGATILTQSSNSMKVFSSRSSKFHLCGTNGLVRHDGSIKTSLNGVNIPCKIFEDDIYTGELKSARGIDNNLLGMVQGFELSLLKSLASYFNFTPVKIISSGGTQSSHLLAPRNVSDVFTEDIWEPSTLYYIISKQAVIAFGDLSIKDPRDRYADFTITHDIDATSFMSKVVRRKLSGERLLTAGGPILTCSYVAGAVFCTLVITVDLRMKSRRKPCHKRTETLDTFFHVVLLLFQPSHPSPAFPKISQQLELLWRLLVLFIGAIFSARIVTYLASVTVDGKVNSILEIAQLLKTHKSARLFHDSRAGQFKQIRYGIIHNDGAQVLASRAVPCRMPKECFDKLMATRLSLTFGEGLVLRRDAWVRDIQAQTHIASETLNNCYQAFALPRGCFFKDLFNKVIRRLLQTGMVERMKDKAGLEYPNAIAVDQSYMMVEMEEIEGLLFILATLLSISVLMFSGECAFTFFRTRVIRVLHQPTSHVYMTEIDVRCSKVFSQQAEQNALQSVRYSFVKRSPSVLVHSTTRHYTIRKYFDKNETL